MTPAVACRPQSTVSETWPGLLENAPIARHWLLDLLAAESDDVRHIVGTVASELITNALRHTQSGQPGGRFMLTVDAGPGSPWIYVSVLDEGAASVPVAAAPPALEDLAIGDLPEAGLGLGQVVSALTVDWGHKKVGSGRSTWAIVARRRAQE